MGNPGRILFDEEKDLRVALGMEDPEVTATLPEQPAKQPKKSLKQPTQKQKLNGSVFLFVPIGLPGMGKSTFWKSALLPQLEKAHPEAYIKRIAFDELHE